MAMKKKYIFATLKLLTFKLTNYPCNHWKQINKNNHEKNIPDY